MVEKTKTALVVCGCGEKIRFDIMKKLNEDYSQVCPNCFELVHISIRRTIRAVVKKENKSKEE